MKKADFVCIVVGMSFVAVCLPVGCGRRDVEKPNPPMISSPEQTRASSGPVVGAPLSEKQKIAALLDVIEKSQATFIRNDQEYPAPAARQLMEYKLKAAADQIKTAQDFIEQVAARSKTTGRVYLVKSADGRTTESAFWLRARLAELERRGR